jgi:hypothetical protein
VYFEKILFLRGTDVLIVQVIGYFGVRSSNTSPIPPSTADFLLVEGDFSPAKPRLDSSALHYLHDTRIVCPRSIRGQYLHETWPHYPPHGWRGPRNCTEEMADEDPRGWRCYIIHHARSWLVLLSLPLSLPSENQSSLYCVRGGIMASGTQPALQTGKTLSLGVWSFKLSSSPSSLLRESFSMCRCYMSQQPPRWHKMILGRST